MRRRGRQHNIALLIFSIGAALAASALQASAAAADPAAATAGSDPLPATAISEFSAVIDDIAASGQVPGLVVAVVRGDEVLLERAIGVTDVRSDQPVTPETVFRIASLSKAFAGALAGLLVADGKLQWETRVADVLPYFRMHDETATANMTVLDLLSHRTGLPDNTYDRRLEDDDAFPVLARELDQIKLACKVGECYGYQNIAFSIFGDMVYPLTGDFFTHQVEKRIFQPLGMSSATYGRAALEGSASWALPHVREGGRFIAVVPKPNYYQVQPAAGVNASIRDLEKWLSAQLGESPTVLSPAILQELHSVRVNTPSQTRFSNWRRTRLRSAGYAVGWRVFNYSGHTVLYHAGAVEGYRAVIAVLPDQRVGMVAAWNCSCSAPGNLVPIFLDRVLKLPPVNWGRLQRPAAKR